MQDHCSTILKPELQQKTFPKSLDMVEFVLNGVMNKQDLLYKSSKYFNRG